MRTKKLFSMKKVMRTMALGLATMLVVGSVNVMEVEAGGVANLEYPEYDSAAGTYNYNSADIFGAATHVHLFGNYVKTSAHTHGNVMAETADLSEIGMRDGKISYPSDYHEVHYVGTGLEGANSNINGDMILGSGITYTDPNVTLTGGGTANLNQYVQGTIYQENPGTKAVNISETMTYLKGLSKSWATLSQSSVVDYDITSDINNRYINTNQTSVGATEHVVVNIPYSKWSGTTTNPVTITGLDSNVNNTGIVIINIDLKGAGDNVNLTLNEIKAKDAQGNYYNNAEHTTAAFGSCRIVYNIIDSSKDDKLYTGKVTFGNTVYGNILAPGADVTVGAVNGNVMADRITHDGQESHRLDIYPIFTVISSVSRVEYEEIRLLLTLTEDPGTNALDSSLTKYSLYKDYAGTQEAVAGADDAFNDIWATWNTTEEKYELIIDSQSINEAVNTHALSAGTYYLVKDSVHHLYQDNGIVFEVNIGTDGTVKYAEAKQSDGSRTTTLDHSVLTDVLTRQAAAVDIEDIVLNLDLIGDTESYAGADPSGTTYQIYTDVACTHKVGSTTATAATWNASDNTFQVVIDGDGLTPNTSYYIKKDDVTIGYNNNTNIYEAHVETSGNIIYRETSTGTFSGSYVGGPLKDVLTNMNDSAELKVEFSGPTGTSAANNSGVKYQIYTDAAATTPVAGSEKEAVKVGSEWTVEFGTDITNTLEKGKDYYIAVSNNGSGYKDVSEDVYKVQFDTVTGEAKYYDSTSGTYVTTPPTDKLIKNEGIQLNVTLEGDTSTGTDSNVKYNVYDSTGNPVLDSTVSATKGSSDTTYKVVVDTAVTTDKLNRQPEVYYIAIDTNSSGYDDKVPNEKFWVKFDNNGNAQYSKDKQTWSDEPLEDILVKATTNNPSSSEPGSEPSSQPTNPPAGNNGNSGNNAGSGGAPGIADPGTNNGGASNNAGNNTAGDNTNKGTADGANANNSATDGANANNSAVTGSNSMNSAKTGEVQTVYIFAGFAALIAIAAGVYVFIKRKRA